MKTARVPRRYVPRGLTRRDQRKQKKQLLQSRKLYRKGIYHIRPSVPSFQSKKSKHILNAEKMYQVDHIDATKELAQATGCNVRALRQIINKGAGAYYSSGSRPNQTAQSWGKARLASAITGGKAAAVDFSILEKGCTRTSRALRLAYLAKKKYHHGTKRVPKVSLLS